MKFIGGFIVGVLTTVLVLFAIYTVQDSNDNLVGLNLFAEKGECITRTELEIFHTIKPNTALAKFGKLPNETLVLLVNYEDKSYYDGQKIPVPAGKCAIQIGTYQYKTNMGIQRTVPAVVIE